MRQCDAFLHVMPDIKYEQALVTHVDILGFGEPRRVIARRPPCALPPPHLSNEWAGVHVTNATSVERQSAV
jgi:hypothetical protein